MRPLAFVALWIALVSLIAGCNYAQTCYQLEGILNPESGTVLVFNKCNGELHLDQIPRLPESPDTNIPDFSADNPKIEL